MYAHFCAYKLYMVYHTSTSRMITYMPVLTVTETRHKGIVCMVSVSKLSLCIATEDD